MSAAGARGVPRRKEGRTSAAGAPASSRSLKDPSLPFRPESPIPSLSPKLCAGLA